LPLTVSDWLVMVSVRIRCAGGSVGGLVGGGGMSKGVGGWGCGVLLLSLWLREMVRLAAHVVAPGVTVPVTARVWLDVLVTGEPWKSSVAVTSAGTVSENV